jgi:hypothetical protein
MAGWITSSPWYGSAGGTPGAGETAAGLTAEPASGGYLILKSNGAVANYHVLLAKQAPQPAQPAPRPDSTGEEPA